MGNANESFLLEGSWRTGGLSGASNPLCWLCIIGVFHYDLAARGEADREGDRAEVDSTGESAGTGSGERSRIRGDIGRMSRSLNAAARALGKRGGKAGIGAAKRRTPEQYLGIQALARLALAEKRRLKALAGVDIVKAP